MAEQKSDTKEKIVPSTKKQLLKRRKELKRARFIQQKDIL